MSTPNARHAALHFQKDFTAAELVGRRQKVMATMKTGTAILAAATEVPGFDPVRQANDFYYLTGCEVPHAYLSMNAETGKCVLYLPPRNERHEKSDGPTLSADDGDFVLSRTGIDEVRPVAQMTTDFANLKDVWIARAPAEGPRQCQDSLRHYQRSIHADPMDGRPSREVHLMSKLAQLSPLANFRDVSPIIHKLRLVKSTAEVEVIRKASQISAMACLESIKSTRAGVYEFQFGALADYVFQINGAQGPGYRPIIAAGKNIWMMHYWRNNQPLCDGDLVIFDYAPDINNYTSDIGRMWPVNGKYSPLQRQLYGFVLEHHRVLLSLIRAGRTADDILKEAADLMRPWVEKQTWANANHKAGAIKTLESKRPLSHGVGMSVHEAAEWRDEPMAAGLVFAVDPELFIPEEEIYIRVEDTVVVTENGCENLTEFCPREMDEVEKLIGQGGILQAFLPALNNPGR